MAWHDEPDGLRKIIAFANELEARKIHYELGKYSPEALMITIALPGGRYEVEFEVNGNITFEAFMSTDGVMWSDESIPTLNEMLQRAQE